MLALGVVGITGAGTQLSISPIVPSARQTLPLTMTWRSHLENISVECWNT